MSSWTCSKGDLCEITYDLHEVQSTQQLRIGEMTISLNRTLLVGRSETFNQHTTQGYCR